MRFVFWEKIEKFSQKSKTGKNHPIRKKIEILAKIENVG